MIILHNFLKKKENLIKSLIKKMSSSNGQVRVLHILKKHALSRRPASWRNPNITQSKEEAIRQIESIRERIANSENAESMISLFRQIASEESDCSSAKQGGDLGFFGRG